MLYLDTFSELDFRRLDAIRADHCVSIYIPTHTVSRETEQDRILFRNAIQKAMSQLSEAGAYRLPRAVSVEVEVSDRFHLKPLIPLLAFPHTAYVLDIAQNQVRFWSVTERQMQEIEVPGMPTSCSDALEQRTGTSEPVSMRQDEHRKVRQRQFARTIEDALRPVLLNQKAPLVLAGVDTILSYYREVTPIRIPRRKSLRAIRSTAGRMNSPPRCAPSSRDGSRIRSAIDSTASRRCVTTGAARPT